MLISLSRRSALALLVAVWTALAASSGCSRQAEGERCDRSANGNADCDDGLVCRTIDVCIDLDRCCPPDGAVVGTNRCVPIVRACNTAGTGGGSGAGGDDAGGTDTGGTSGSDTGGTSGGDTGGTSGGDTGGMSGGGTGGTEPDPVSGAGGEPAAGAGGA